MSQAALAMSAPRDNTQVVQRLSRAYANMLDLYRVIMAHGSPEEAGSFFLNSVTTIVACFLPVTATPSDAEVRVCGGRLDVRIG